MQIAAKVNCLSLHREAVPREALGEDVFAAICDVRPRISHQNALRTDQLPDCRQPGSFPETGFEEAGGLITKSQLAGQLTRDRKNRANLGFLPPPCGE